MFELVDGYFGKKVRGKLANQRKPQDYSVSPMSDGRIMVQSDKSIGTFDFRTRMGVLNTKGSYFPHLHPVMGAVAFEFPVEFVTLAMEACPALDSVTKVGGFMTIVNTVQVF